MGPAATVICTGWLPKPFLERICGSKVPRALRRYTQWRHHRSAVARPVSSFKVFRSQGGAKDDAHCSSLVLLTLGPSPNKSLQRTAQP
jgi:hypothetical protein